MHPFFMNLYTLYSTKKPMDASGLATDFFIQQTILLVAIVFIQWPHRGNGAGNSLGELYILAIAGWILLQKKCLRWARYASRPQGVVSNPLLRLWRLACRGRKMYLGGYDHHKILQGSCLSAFRLVEYVNPDFIETEFRVTRRVLLPSPFLLLRHT